MTAFNLFAAWRSILHISEWTGLSLGALAAIGIVVYLDPRLLKPAIIGAIALALVYGGTLYGDATGRADVKAQWADARKAEIAAAQERDAMTEQQLEAKYAPQLAELQKQINADSKGPDNAVANAVSDGCKLGARANRVRVN